MNSHSFFQAECRFHKLFFIKTRRFSNEVSRISFVDTAPISHNDPTVVYIGSTTGTSYSNEHCSPFQVTWDVKTTCDTLDIDDFSKWCSHNKYDDHHAHGVRELVTPEAVLSEISK